MEKQKAIVFFHKNEHFDKYNSLNRNFYQNNSIKIIACSLNSRIYLKSKNIDYDIEENYVKNVDPKKMDSIAIHISENWHKNLFKFHGVSLGLLDEHENSLYFARLIRNIQIFLNIIDTERPSEIISFIDNNEYIKEFNDNLKYICSMKNIHLNLILIEEPASINKKNELKKNYLVILKFLYGYIRSQFYKFLSNIFLNLKILFHRKRKNILVFHPRYHDSIIKELSKNYNIFLPTDKNNPNKLDLIQNFRNILNRKRGIYHIFLGIYGTRKINKQTDIYFKKKFKKWKAIVNNTNFKEIFCYNDISIWPIVKSKIYTDLAYNFKDYIKTILIQYNYLKKTRINAIIYGYDTMGMFMSLAIISSKLKIPSVVVQHGIVGGVFYFHGFVPSFSTKFAAWGKITRELLTNCGMDSKEIVITGCPRFDEYIYLNQNGSHKNKIKNSVYEYFKIEKDKRVILLASVYSDLYRRFNTNLSVSYIEKFLEISFNAIKNIPDSHLIVKLHPGDANSSVIFDMKKLYDIKNITITKDYNITDLIVACDCFISEESTTVIEAMLLEKPIICINLKEREYTASYFKYQVAYKATNYEEFVNQIQKAFNNPVPLKNYKEFLRDYIYNIDGLSTKRVTCLVNKLISNL